jgi:hypothetical protein
MKALPTSPPIPSQGAWNPYRVSHPLAAMTQNPRSLVLCWFLVFAVWFCPPHRAEAASIAWGSGFEATLLNSAGNPLDASFSFELGSFGSFVPTLLNFNDWANHWKVFDRAFESDANGWAWDESERFFVGFAGHQSDGTSDSPQATPGAVFNEGEQIYLWVFNSKALLESSEWALVSDFSGSINGGDAWSFPDPTIPSSVTFDIQLSDADTAIIGGVNGTRGAGDFAATPTEFHIQTATLPIPEPSSLLLVFLSAALINRRHRNRL